MSVCFTAVWASRVSRGFPHSNPYDAMGPDSWHGVGAEVDSGGGWGWGPTETLPAYSTTAAPMPEQSSGVSRGDWRENWGDMTSVEMSPVYSPRPQPSSERPRWLPRMSCKSDNAQRHTGPQGFCLCLRCGSLYCVQVCVCLRWCIFPVSNVKLAVFVVSKTKISILGLF